MRPEDSFRTRFLRAPQVIVAAPGRVNLIGEHTDYSLLPVMPIAIDRSVVVAAAVDRERTEIHSDHEPAPALGKGGAGWDRYVAAALRQTGFDSGVIGTITSDLPATGGLSSSSALMMALISSLAALDGAAPAVDEVAQAAIDAERHVGVESGTMDQTVIAHARAGTALRIDFRADGPATLTFTAIPEHLRFVVAYSGAPAHKGGNARRAYNASVVACRAASVLLAYRLGLPVADPPRLAAVAEAAGVEEAICDLPQAMSGRQAAASAGIDARRLVALSAGDFDPDEPLGVRSAAQHVIFEAARVGRAQRALEAGDLAGLGRLMDESHASLVRFGASTPALDAVTAAMRAAGAAGARLTGAGFGGNAVAICPPSAVRAVIAAAERATGGPAFEVVASDGLRRLV